MASASETAAQMSCEVYLNVPPPSVRPELMFQIQRVRMKTWCEAV